MLPTLKPRIPSEYVDNSVWGFNIGVVCTTLAIFISALTIWMIPVAILSYSVAWWQLIKGTKQIMGYW